MSTRAIVSYDDTPNDHDALQLGRVLVDAGAELTLAYVRHSKQIGERERLAEHEAEALLNRGAQWLEHPEVERRVVVSGSTGDGIARLAEEEHADIVVFGSEYRTPAGHVSPQHSTEKLLEGASTAAVAIAPANYSDDHSPQIRTIGLLASAGDDAAIDTARELADRFDATITRDERRVDLLVVGSRPEAPEGHVMISAQATRAIEDTNAPVIVVARGVALRFAPLVVAAV
jgi:nucleotide-binding universal stress UspA family protein